MSGTSSSIRRGIDYGRLGRAIDSPEMVWLAYARVDDDDDAITFDPNDGEGRGLGWLIDVTFSGGPLDGEGPVPCRVSSSFANEDNGRIEPVERGCEVLVAIPSGDPNDGPVIIAQIHNGGDCKVPAEVNGDEITEDFAKSTHIFVTPHAIDEQIAGTRRIKSGDTHRILGPLVELADEDAGQSFVKGDDQKDTLDSFLDALKAWAVLVKVGIAAAGGTLDNTALDLAIEQAKAGLQQALSEKIKGE